MIYRFGEFELDTNARLLRQAGLPVELPRRVFDCLLCLIERQPSAVSRDELIQHVWGRANVSDNQLAQAVLRARRALGDSGEAPRHIGTVPGYGYRWLAALQTVEPAADEVQSAPLERMHVPGRHPRTRGHWLGAAATVTALGLVLVGLLSQGAAAPEPTASTLGGYAVLPADVAQAERAGWARHGLMAVVNARFSEAGLKPLALDKVLARLPAESTTASPTPEALHRLLEGRSPVRIFAEPEHATGGWRVALRLDADPQLTSEARHPDLIEATGRAADGLLAALGHALPQADEGAVLAQARRALQRHDFQGTRLALERLSATERAGTEAELLAIELELATGQLARAGTLIDALAQQVRSDSESFDPQRLQLLRVQWQRASGQPIDAAELQALVARLEVQHAPPALLARALQARGSLALGSGRGETAGPDFARAHRLFLDAGETMRAASVNSNLAMLALVDGRHVEALNLLNEAAAVFRAEGEVGRLFNVLGSIDALHMGQLHWRQALEFSDSAGALLPLIEEASGRLSYYRRRALIVLGLGRLDEAQALLAQAEQEAARGEPNPDSQARAGLYVAQLALARGDGAAAYAAALPVFSHVHARHGAGPEPRVRTDARDLALQLMMQGLWLQSRRSTGWTLPELPMAAEDTLAQAQSALALVARGRWRELRGETAAAEADLRAALANAQAFNRLTRIFTATEALTELLLAQGRHMEAEAAFLALLARAPDLIERDYDAALLELRLKWATEDAAGIARAHSRVQALAGQREVPAGARAPGLQLSALGR